MFPEINRVVPESQVLVMDRKRLLVLFSVLLIGLSLMTAGCTDQDSAQAGELAEIENTAEGSQAVDVVNLSGGDCGYPQPFTIYPRGPGSSKVRMIFDSLLVSPDGTEYTFHLREGVV